MKRLLFFLTLAGSTSVAYANSGFPMIFNTLPFMILALIPLIISEAAVIQKHTQAPSKTVLKAVAGANLLSTFVGLPLSNALGLLLTWASYATGISWHHISNSVASTLAKATLGFFWFDTSRWSTLLNDKIPHTYQKEPEWYYYLAIAFAILVNYLVSWYIEYAYLKKRLDAPHNAIRNGAIYANTLSYLIIVLMLLFKYITDKYK
ncbi:hypothetical protein [Giesbergeria sinuosa]